MQIILLCTCQLCRSRSASSHDELTSQAWEFMQTHDKQRCQKCQPNPHWEYCRSSLLNSTWPKVLTLPSRKMNPNCQCLQSRRRLAKLSPTNRRNWHFVGRKEICQMVHKQQNKKISPMSCCIATMSNCRYHSSKQSTQPITGVELYQNAKTPVDNSRTNLYSRQFANEQ